jgi:tetratricopeptide (TPR) repeat protein
LRVELLREWSGRAVFCATSSIAALRNEPNSLKETLLEIEVFDRPSDWDPRLDPVVRQEAARLRKRLARHYETEGAGTGVRIDHPVGTYVPVFSETVTIAAAEPAPQAAGKPAPTARARRLWLSGAALVLALGIGTFLAIQTPRRDSPAPRRDAQEFYLQGLHEWQKRTPDSLTRAVDLFTQAVVRDSRYALPYVGLADCYNLLREYSAMSDREAYPRALAATQKALELDPRSAEAHASLAFISFWWN